jgi:SAM-dependent methyltransferase
MAFVMDGWLELVCPVCKGELAPPADPRAGTLRCEPCARGYQIVHGIPDLRVFADPYIPVVGDIAKARMLHSEFGQRDLAGIIELYYAMTPEVPPEHVRLNMSRMLGGVARATVALDSWEREFGTLAGATRLLDLGCGEAPLVVAASRRVPQVAGVDIGFRHITMGSKQLEQEGVRAPLVAACAEALPFRDGTFDVVTVQHAVELFQDQAAALAEAYRVTRTGGRILVSAPNRWSLGPDPHIGVPGGGLLPRAAVNLVARLRMVRPPHRHLLSAASLARRLRSAGYSGVRVGIPGLADSQRAQFTGLARVAADAYERMRTGRVMRHVLRTIGPLLQAVGTRS